MSKICVIGCGNLGSAIARGLLFTKACQSADLYLCSRTRESVQPLANELGVNNQFLSPRDIPADVDVVFICVKPADTRTALEQLAKAPKATNRTVLSTVAGISSANLELWYNKRGVPVARVMPNVACAVGSGAIGVFSSAELSSDVADVLQKLGSVVYLQKEDQLNAVTALAGSSPAFVAEMLLALIDGGVLAGLKRSDAEKLSFAVLAGTSKLLEREEHSLVELRNSITSPGGTTINGLFQLENHGFRKSVLQALKAASERGKEINEALKTID